jgi:hypothetical protein
VALKSSRTISGGTTTPDSPYQVRRIRRDELMNVQPVALVNAVIGRDQERDLVDRDIAQADINGNQVFRSAERKRTKQRRE